MISNQILQSTIEGLKAITRIDLCVMDIDGRTIASTCAGVADYESAVRSFVETSSDSQFMQGCYFTKIYDE